MTKTEKLLLPVEKNTEKIIEQTIARPQGTLQFK